MDSGQTTGFCVQIANGLLDRADTVDRVHSEPLPGSHAGR
jgi:hypothetical protein